MPLVFLLSVLAGLTAAGYGLGRTAAVRRGGRHGLPGHHGAYVALWTALPALALTAPWLAAQGWVVMRLVLGDSAGLEMGAGGVPAVGDPAALALLKADILNLAHGVAGVRPPAPWVAAAAERYARLMELGRWALLALGAALAAGGLLAARRRIGPDLRAREAVERAAEWALVACSLVAILTTIGIVLSLLFEALRFFAVYAPLDFLFGLHWSPQTALRADQVGSSGSFGAVPLFAGTLLITVIAMLVAVPVGLMAAIYLSEYAGRRVRAVLKPALEVLAGIPTVVYGFFAALTMAPLVRDAARAVGLAASSESALAAGLVMGVMIIPFVSSLSDDVINAVPQGLRDGSLGLGATRSETIRQVVLPAALPGVVAAVMLAVSRAVGETMIVTMAAGLTANLTANPLRPVSTVTTQIATLLVGDQEFDSPKTLSAFGLGLVLFLVTLALNVVALRVVRRYRDRHD